MTNSTNIAWPGETSPFGLLTKNVLEPAAPYSTLDGLGRLYSNRRATWARKPPLVVARLKPEVLAEWQRWHHIHFYFADSHGDPRRMWQGGHLPSTWLDRQKKLEKLIAEARQNRLDRIGERNSRQRKEKADLLASVPDNAPAANARILRLIGQAIDEMDLCLYPNRRVATHLMLDQRVAGYLSSFASYWHIDKTDTGIRFYILKSSLPSDVITIPELRNQLYVVDLLRTHARATLKGADLKEAERLLLPGGAQIDHVAEAAKFLGVLLKPQPGDILHGNENMPHQSHRLQHGERAATGLMRLAFV